MKIGAYSDLKNTILKLKKGDLEDVPPFFRSKVFSWILILIFASIITLLATVSLQYIPSGIAEGMIAPRNIKADRNYEITDKEATEKIRNEAVVGILPVYDLEDAVSASIAERIKLAFANARVKYQSQMDLLKSRKQKKDLLSEEESEVLRNLFAENLGVLPSQTQWKLLLGERLDVRSENYLIDLIIKALEKPVIAERVALDAEAANGIMVRRKISVDGEASPEIKEATVKDLSHILTTDEARKSIAKIELPNYEFRNPEFASKIKALAQELIEPNFGLNRLETQRRRDDAALKVKSVVLKVKSGEMIIREGARYEPWHIKVIEGIRNEKRRGMYPLEFIGTFVLVMLFIVFPFYLAERFFRRIRPNKADHILMAFIAISILLIERFYILLAPGLHDAFFFNAPITALHYAIPIAGGAMLLRMYLGPEISMVFALSMSALSGLLLEADMNFYVYIIMTSLGAVIAVARVDKRSSILKAGLITGAIGVAAIVGSSMIGFASASMSASFSGMMWGILLALIGGIGCSIYTMLAAPIVESVSGYTSDIKLLELANLNHPLLRELIVRAPGTYHHSHLVGILGEAAAEAIGANPLLVRVGAYYHDIGKLKKPQYFIENSKGGENKHEKISPNMSALVISAHVKDGMELALTSGIPKRIADMIPQHHGTRLMNYFYVKAKESENPDVEKVDEKDFRYPGPKPQTREAAILMLADTVEASVRALKEKGSARIQQTVERSINDIFAESQLDDCELTLQDLHDIAKAFVRILLGIYHQRIEYPKNEEDKNEINIIDENSTRQTDSLESSPEEESEPQVS